MSAAGGHDDEGNGRRRLIVGTLALSLAPWQIARGATLLGVRVWPAPAYTRVTLEHDAPLGFNHFALDNPPRLVIDVDGIELNARFKELVGKIDADDPFIAGIRLGQNRPHVVRVVIELKQDVRPQVFSLAPVGPYQHRLVMDLHSLTPVDPLLALLQEHEQRGAVSAEPRPATPPTEAADRVDRIDRSAPAERNLARERAPGTRRGAQPATACRGRIDRTHNPFCSRSWRSRASLSAT